MNKKALLETAKSAARALWFALLGLLSVFLTSLATSASLAHSTVTVAGLQVSVGVVILAGVGLVTKAIDTYVHKNENIKSNGIAPSFLQG